MKNETADTLRALSMLMNGETVISIQDYDDCRNNAISIIFSDGSRLIIEYDWIYELNFIAGDKQSVTERMK
jgi:hypothetical protein